MEPEQFVLETNIVTVSIQYRLAQFGFWYNPNKPDYANAGILDQQLALKWVNKFISYFHGDSSQVTLSGCRNG